MLAAAYPGTGSSLLHELIAAAQEGTQASLRSVLQYAEGHPIVAALLRICPKHRRGCYTVATADLMNALGAPMSQVCYVHSTCH